MYSRFSQTANEFLNAIDISTFSTDIFEESILRLAGVETKPTSCHFGNEGDEQVYITYSGLNSDDRDKLTTFFAEKCEMGNVQPQSISITTDENPQDEIEDTFILDGEKIIEKLWPLVENHINHLKENEPNLIKDYQDKSINDASLKLYQLEKILNSISELSKNLETSCTDLFIKGQLDILFADLADAIGQYEMHYMIVDNCGSGEELVKSEIDRIKDITNTEQFAENQIAKDLNNTFAKYENIISQRQTERQAAQARDAKIRQNLRLFMQPLVIPQEKGPDLEEANEERKSSNCRIM